ncbi:hypothetical protein D3C78_1845540 [compost metagenome]
MPTISKPAGRSSDCTFTKSGTSCRHGGHQVAQKLTSTTLPLNWDKDTELPPT